MFGPEIYVNEPKSFYELLKAKESWNQAHSLIENQLTGSQVRKLIDNAEKDPGFNPGFHRQLLTLERDLSAPELTLIVAKFYRKSSRPLSCEQFKDGRVFKSDSLPVIFKEMILRKTYLLLSEILLRIDHPDLLSVFEKIVSSIRSDVFPLEYTDETDRLMGILIERLRHQVRNDPDSLSRYNQLICKLYQMKSNHTYYFIYASDSEPTQTLCIGHQLTVKRVWADGLIVAQNLLPNHKDFLHLTRIEQAMVLGSTNHAAHTELFGNKSRLAFLDHFFREYFCYATQTKFDFLDKINFGKEPIEGDERIFSKIITMEYYPALFYVFKSLPLVKQVLILSRLNEYAWKTMDEYSEAAYPYLIKMIELIVFSKVPSSIPEEVGQAIREVFALALARLNKTEPCLARYYDKFHLVLKAEQNSFDLVRSFVESWREALISLDSRSSGSHWFGTQINIPALLLQEVADSFDSDRLQMILFSFRKVNLMYLVTKMSPQAQSKIIFTYLRSSSAQITGSILSALYEVESLKSLLLDCLADQPDHLLSLMKFNIDEGTMAFFQMSGEQKSRLSSQPSFPHLLNRLIDLLAFGRAVDFSMDGIFAIPKPEDEDLNAGKKIDVQEYFRNKAKMLLEIMLELSEVELHWEQRVVDRFVNLARHGTQTINRHILSRASKISRDALGAAILNQGPFDPSRKQGLSYWASTDEFHQLLVREPVIVPPPYVYHYPPYMNFPMPDAPPYIELIEASTQTDFEPETQDLQSELEQLRETNHQLQTTVQKQLRFISEYCIEVEQIRRAFQSGKLGTRKI